MFWLARRINFLPGKELEIQSLFSTRVRVSSSGPLPARSVDNWYIKV